jgi:nitrite reductase/ring-hydroxylating ferredoxin subunit
VGSFKHIARSSEVKERFGTGKHIDGLYIALFRNKGQVYALKDSCPHQGAPIHQGMIREGCLVCPQHGWTFRLEDGAFTHNEMVRIKTYPVEEKDGNIFIDIQPDTEQF